MSRFSRKFVVDKATGELVEITSEEVRSVCDEISAETQAVRKTLSNRDLKPSRTRKATYPFYSYAVATNPDDVPKVQKYLRQHGIPTDFNKHGEPRFESPSHRKRYCELFGVFDRNAGYSDPQPKHC